MAELLQNTSNFKKVQEKKTQFLLIYLFLFLKLPLFSLKKIKVLRVSIFFDNILFCSAYADDTKFFVSDEDSVIKVINAFHKFSLVSGLTPNDTKCEIAGIAFLKGVSLALCGMDCTDLTKKR